LTKLTVCIVTWNSERYIGKVLDCLEKQTFRDFELLIVDNNSTDNTIKVVSNSKLQPKIIINKENTGFCGGHNIGISESRGTYYMPLNPDIFIEADFLENMILAMEMHPSEKVGMVSGKLLRFDPTENKKTDVIDSTGIFFKKNRRSLDRGSDLKDEGQFEKTEFVFGASGAAPLYRKEMLIDIQINGQYFMNYFFAYREDVDLAWRAQHRLWKCIYYPKAIAYHVRHNTPEKRKVMSSQINMHSVKNRLLLLIQNESKYGFIANGIYFLYYDLLIFVYVLLKERESLPAFKFIYINFREVMNVRSIIQTRSLIKSQKEFSKWFGDIQFKNI
jgi:GT2 family glycosyltransferase